MNKVDILAFAAHPDDVELACSGTIIKHVQMGHKAAIVDMTRGELGTRGNAELRLQEADHARDILGLQDRINLGMRDGFFEPTEENKLRLIGTLRYFRPDVVLLNAPEDRHPDHGRAAKLQLDACFLSGLRKVETSWQGQSQQPWRPRLMLHYIQDYYLKPEIVVDITAHWEQKINSIKAFSSQFYNPGSNEPESPISGKEFFDFLAGRAAQIGRPVNAKYGEGFITVRPTGVKSLLDLL